MIIIILGGCNSRVSEYHASAYPVSCEIYAQQYEEYSRRSLTDKQIKQELLKASDDILLYEIFGGSTNFISAEYMTVCDRYVLAQIEGVCYIFPRELLLSYEIKVAGQDYNIIWTLADINCCYMSPRYFQPRVPVKLTDESSVTVRFYYLCHEIDPYFMLLPEAYLYISEEISGQYLWEEFIRLMYEHTAIRIWDWWFEGSKLYVDLHSIEKIFFDQGSSGSMDRGTRLLKTLASLPGISSFEMLVGGYHGVGTSHYCFDWVANVENGEIIGFDYR